MEKKKKKEKERRGKDIPRNQTVLNKFDVVTDVNAYEVLYIKKATSCELSVFGGGGREEASQLSRKLRSR